METLYIEHINGVPLTPAEQRGPILQSNLRLATEQEVEDARKHYEEHKECKCHLVYDKPGFDWDLRYCGICNEFICLI